MSDPHHLVTGYSWKSTRSMKGLAVLAAPKWRWGQPIAPLSGMLLASREHISPSRSTILQRVHLRAH